MKTINIFYCLLIFLSLFGGCKKESLDPNSVFVDNPITKNELDKFIEREYTTKYNVGVLYKYIDNESDMNYNLSPAGYKNSVIMTKLFKYLGIEPYDELTKGTAFIRSYFPKNLSYIGSPAYRNNGTMVLGTAEGGRKITMYNVNGLDETTAKDIAYLNGMYFHTIHHEFGHILNQTKPFPISFNQITAKSYTADSWNGLSNAKAAELGFVSPYASKEANEDFVEIYSYYITLTATQWDARISAGGPVGKALINAKLDIVKNYFMKSWNIDMDQLRTIILDRQANLPTLDITSLN